jgi:hypothetical protein
MHRLKEPLQSFEAFFALYVEYIIPVSLSRPMPPGRDQSSSLGDIFLSDKRHPRDVTPSGAGDVKGQATGAAGDLEYVMVRGEVEPGYGPHGLA